MSFNQAGVLKALSELHLTSLAMGATVQQLFLYSVCTVGDGRRTVDEQGLVEPKAIQRSSTDESGPS
jgi:hypothetical protein